LLVPCLFFMCTPERGTAQNSALDGLTLVWTAPAQCPDQAEVLARIANHLQLPTPRDQRWRIEARVVHQRPQYALELSLEREGSEPAVRSLRAANCEALADATAVLVALALEPQPSAAGSTEVEDSTSTGASRAAANGSREAAAAAQMANAEARAEAQDSKPPSPAPPPSPSSAVPEAKKPAAESGETAPARLRLGLAAGLRLDFGMLPRSPNFGVTGRAELRFRRLRAAAGFSVLPASEGTAVAYPRARLRAHALLGDGMLGVAITDGALSVVPCAVFEYGSSTLASLQIADGVRQSIGWTAAGIGAHARYRLAAGFELGVETTGLMPFSRPHWWVRTERGDVTVFEAAVIAVRVTAGLAYVFE
jgi:hypothetical protein